MSEREKLIAELEDAGLSHEIAVTMADDWLKRGGNQEPPERCKICGSERIHVYPVEEGEETIAVCLHCGAHYHSFLGWVDPEDL